MKKKQPDSQKTSELLRKLQEAVLSSHKKDTSREAPDSDDLEFQKKITGMLNRVTGQAPSEKPSKKTKKAESLPPNPQKEVSENRKTDTLESLPKEENPKEPSVSVKKEAEKTVSAKQSINQKKVTKSKKPSVTPSEDTAKTIALLDEPEQSSVSDLKETAENPTQTVATEPIESAVSTCETTSLDQTEHSDESDIPSPLLEETQQETSDGETVTEQPQNCADASNTIAEDTPDSPQKPIPEEIFETLETEPVESADSEELPFEQLSIDNIIPSEEVSENTVVKSQEVAKPLQVTPDVAVLPKQQNEKTVSKEKMSVAAKSIPIQIPKEPSKPLVRVIPAKPTAATEKKKESDAIVIAPKSNLKSTVPIVINPHKATETNQPIRVEVKTSMPKASEFKNTNTPIRVIPPKMPTSAAPSVPPSKKENTQKPSETSAKNVTVPKMPKRKTPPAVPSPRSTREPSSASKSRTVKKRPTQIPKPLQQEDEGLDIVLENVQSEQIIETPQREENPYNIPQETSSLSKKEKTDFFSMLSAEEILKYTEKKTGLTADDVSMIFELGYESELGNLIGQDALKKIRSKYIRATHSADKEHYRTAFGYRNQEYTGEQSRDLILANYVHDKKVLIVRLALTALMMLLLLPLEIPSLLQTLIHPNGQIAVILFPLLRLCILLFAGCMSFKQLQAGIKSFLHISPTPYSAVGLLFPLAVVGGVINLFLAGNGNPLVSLALPTVGTLLLTAICDALRLFSEMKVFRILSAEDDKTVLEQTQLHKKKLRHGDKVVKIINDDVDQNLYSLQKTHTVSGFFRRCNDTESAIRPFGFLLLATLTFSFLTGLFSVVCGKEFSTVASTVLLTFYFALPIPSVLLFSYPLSYANRLLTHRNCALVGEESVMEYSQPKTVIFRDRDMYSIKKCTQTMAREGEDFRQDMRLAALLFREMNGALNDSGADRGKSSVTFVRLAESGTEALVEHHHLLAGDAKFLSKSGVRVPKETTDRASKRSENTVLMYVAINGILKLTYEIEYTLSHAFEEQVAILARHSACSAILTCNPNINDNFLQQTMGDCAEYVRIIKPSRYEQEETSEVSDSGVVALSERFDVTRPVIAATLIQRIRTDGYRIQAAIAFIGALLALLLTFKQSQLLSGIPVLVAILFQGLAVGAAYLATHLVFRFGNPENFK